MTTLRQAVEGYLSLRRALGFQLRDVGTALARFLAFCEAEGAAVVTADLARRWAVSAERITGPGGLAASDRSRFRHPSPGQRSTDRDPAEGSFPVPSPSQDPVPLFR